MQHNDGLLDGAQHITGLHLVSRFGGGGKLPLLLPGDGIYFNATLDGIAHLAANVLQGTLDAVVDLTDQARPQLHRQRRTGGHHILPGADACGFLIHLDGGLVAPHLDDLADQVLGTYPHHIEHIGVGHALGNDQGARHLDDFSYIIHSISNLLSLTGRPFLP